MGRAEKQLPCLPTHSKLHYRDGQVSDSFAGFGFQFSDLFLSRRQTDEQTSGKNDGRMDGPRRKHICIFSNEEYIIGLARLAMHFFTPKPNSELKPNLPPTNLLWSLLILAPEQHHVRSTKTNALQPSI